MPLFSHVLPNLVSIWFFLDVTLPQVNAHGTRPHVQPFRMRPNDGASGSQGTPVRRSARQAGEDPAPPQSPPPPPVQEPSPSQIMMMMDERHSQHLTHIMREFGTYMQAQNAPRPGHSKLQDFQRTQPPKFSFADDPLEADDWLRTMEKKLELARVDELDKVLFSTHYLEGPANVWWDNQKTARGDGPPATWT